MPTAATAAVMLPDAPALTAGAAGAVWLSGDGEVESLPLKEAARRLEAGAAPLVCNGRAMARRLGTARLPMFDLLELFAFARPARFCLPTARGLAEALDLPAPDTHEREAETLFTAAAALLADLAALDAGAAAQARGVAWVMARGHWPWGPAVLRALGAEPGTSPRSPLDGLRVWTRLPKWEDDGPLPPPGTLPVEPVEARAALKRLLGADSEERPQQRDYASAAAAAFLPRDKQGEPRLVLAEAGTGVGKTLGYIAPASVWARKNEGSVWISTFTRNLQRQLDGELDRLYPDPAEKARKVVVRKGRENYFCLLNYQEAVDRLAIGAADPVALGLMARWALATRDGDMAGGDFPAWLTDLLGWAATLDMTDTRGECTYAACLHYGRCFIERSIRRARRAEIVVANHALVMVQAALGGAMGGGDESTLPGRYVFDEGHHVFGAADSAFSAHLTGYEAADLRRWILGAEDSRRSRARGLRGRIDDLIADDERARELRDEILRAARALAGPGWRQRLAGGTPVGPTEAFLALVRQQVLARDENVDGAYSLETATQPPVPGLIEAADELAAALLRLEKPVAGLVGALFATLDTRAEDLDTATRNRIEAVCRSLERRAVLPLRGWRAMLAALAAETPPQFVDWFGVERADGHERDLGMHRHWVDPTLPFHEAVTEPAQGVLITSATLRDASGDEDADWAAADARTGAGHARAPAVHAAVPSPFDYPAQTRVLVVTDVGKNRAEDVAAAYRELFLAAGGGALGLFTAISRLRAVYQRIAAPLDRAGIELLAQHVDPMDTGTLIDIFRATEDACLLGTDAVRDGVDVPGRSLRLIVFDRVPWPRPDILHKARRRAFGGRAYDEMLTRLKLKQAYGRLVRRAGDRGVFVMLDRALPSRLAGAFPDGVEVTRLGLRDAVAATREFLGPGSGGLGRQDDQRQAQDQGAHGAPEGEW
ncbi:MAG: ATP-dependent DNA helicase [Hyphomicrobiales bacterium]|nr:ATP-dependent DNA helicase [Hyphomicrobiales bacterium]MCP5373366.1 ATP-dependent DNA helicase [Hyphomicrobiales bacterium]